MIDDDSERIAAEILSAGRRGRRFDETPEEIRVVDRVHALHDGRKPLEPHALVDRRLRQRREFALGVAVELHEDEVPDLDVAVALGVGGTRRPARNALAVIVEDLRTRPAWPRVAHGPEVLFRADPGETALVDADVVEPEGCGFVVVEVDRAPEALGRQTEHFGHVLPGETDRVALEVVAETEVAEHLEEREMPVRVADVLEVVVLAPGPQAALRGHRPLRMRAIPGPGTRP